MFALIKQCPSCGTRVNVSSHNVELAVRSLKEKGWERFLFSWYCRSCSNRIAVRIQISVVIVGLLIGAFVAVKWIW